jgi:glutamyl-tRNA synthetase
MAPDGKKKLGKRDGAKSAQDYRKDGILPETMLNFLASMGWNDGTEQEIFSRDELIAKFSLDKVQRSGACFDEKRLLWMNGQWIRKLSTSDLYTRTNNFWPEEASQASDEEKMKVLELVKDRLKTLKDLSLITPYFFTEPTIDLSMISNNKQLGKLSNEQVKSLLKEAKEVLIKCDFDSVSIQNALNKLLEKTEQKPIILFSLIRLAVSWAPFSPALNETLFTIGKDKVQSRLEKTINSIL